jgi:hypothetical protein
LSAAAKLPWVMLRRAAATSSSARAFWARSSLLPVVAAPRTGGAALQIAPAAIGAEAPAAVLDDAIGVVVLLALNALVDRRQDQPQIVLLPLGSDPAPSEIGPCLPDFGETWRGADRPPRAGRSASTKSPRSIACRAIAICARAWLTRPGTARRAKLRERVEPRAVFVVLVEALRVFGEQALASQIVRRQRHGRSRGILVALAIALAALGTQGRDLGAGLCDLGEARRLFVGVLQHLLGMGEIADLGEGRRLRRSAALPRSWRSCTSRSARAFASFCCSGGQAALRHSARRVGQQPVGAAKSPAGDGPIDRGRERARSASDVVGAATGGGGGARRRGGREVGKDELRLLAGELSLTPSSGWAHDSTAPDWSRSHATVRPSLRPRPCRQRLLGVARQRQLGAVALGAPQELGAAVPALRPAQQRGAVTMRSPCLTSKVPSGLASPTVESSLLQRSSRHDRATSLALLEIGLLVRKEVARAGKPSGSIAACARSLSATPSILIGLQNVSPRQIHGAPFRRNTYLVSAGSNSSAD